MNIVNDQNRNEENDNYNYLVKKFGKERIKNRFDWMEHLLCDFIQKKNYQERVIISHDLLKHVIVDYFVDIDRLKEFQGIERVHISKIYAYLSYWLLRHKVLQVTVPDGAAELAFVNEDFVTYFLRSYLFSDPENVVILQEQEKCIDNFVETMRYHFQYREYSAKNIELMLLAFQAGCAYQYSADHIS